MFPSTYRHRRARRTDAAAIRWLLESSGLPVPGSDRRALRHFRRVVADLGADLYVAVTEVDVVGLVHVTYSRTLTGAPWAHLELLVVDPRARGRGVGRGLMALAARRARRRGGAILRCAGAAKSDGARAFLMRSGWLPVGDELQFDLADGAQ